MSQVLRSRGDGEHEVYFSSASRGNADGPDTRGWLRASKRALNTERSTDWRPVRDYSIDQPLQPGEVVRVDIPLMPSGTTFRAGEWSHRPTILWPMRAPVE